MFDENNIKIKVLEKTPEHLHIQVDFIPIPNLNIPNDMEKFLTEFSQAVASKMRHFSQLEMSDPDTEE
jgi:hypothetical protein